MGLSGRKTKQRIPNDPRNLAWANDANKFGAAYLAKLGWDPSRGLGVSGEGRTKALSVTQKLDMLGIGADHRDSAEGIAWKQNKDFENLLKRLNAANGKEELDEELTKIDGFVRPSVAHEGKDEGPSSGTKEVVMDVEDSGKKKEKKKRKKGEEDEGEERKKKRKKKSCDDASDAEERSKEKKKKKKKKKKKRDTQEGAAVASAETELSASSVPASKPLSKHPRAAFRGRHMAAKSLASKSSSAIAEILGISPIPSASVSGYPSSAPTPYPSTPYEPGPSTSSSSDSSGSATPADEIKLQELTVSSKSVMDYFKEKLAAKNNARVSSSTDNPSPGTPAVAEDDYDQRPRGGLGASRLRTEVARPLETETVGTVERRGLGGIGSGMRSSFAAMFASATATSASILTDAEVSAPVAEDDVPGAQGGEEEESPKSKKQHKERKKEKKVRKDKGKEKAKIEVPDAAQHDAREEEGVDVKAERKWRKEEKRRRKEAEAEAEASEVVVGVEEGGGVTDAEVRDRQRRKDKKKNKAES